LVRIILVLFGLLESRNILGDGQLDGCRGFLIVVMVTDFGRGLVDRDFISSISQCCVRVV